MLIVFMIFMLYPIAALLYIPSFYTFVGLVCVFLLSFPFLVTYRFTGEIESKIKMDFPQVPFIVVLFGFLVGLVNLYIISSNVGGGVGDIFSIDGIRTISYKSTLIRYEKSSTVNSGNPYILAISLFMVFVVGLRQNNSSKMKIVLLFIPIFLYTVLTTEKWPAFLGFVFYFSGIFYSNDLRGISTFLRQNAKYLALIPVLVISTIMIRSGETESISSLLNMVFHYVLSPFYGLGFWLVNSYHDVTLSLGEYTLIGPLSFFSSFTGVFRNSGVFLENYYVYGNVTNIYTAFRYLIQDFSIQGVLLLNVIISIFYSSFVRNKKYELSEVIRLVLVFCALLSLNVTIAVHNSILLSILMCASYVYICLTRKSL
ncbi:O-antigen polymerase [Vibrio toranzoniae]|uniref:O-antigen polymerase n=1 Tax=Vibrio toranzoniae TaxID=1194427 RepID=UPI00137873A5|nr:O-antigen polymerase [Vibrio toranzoniae]NAZ70716.1 oligosaccharide repeat unit polymerase [Vibrio toranzoniae]